MNAQCVTSEASTTWGSGLSFDAHAPSSTANIATVNSFRMTRPDRQSRA
jgi:hypothetical protein